MNLKSWIRRKPVPVQLRVQTSAGERVLALETSGARRFAKAEQAVFALEATRVEALDEKGNVLRVSQLEVESDEDDAPVKEAMPESDHAKMLMLFAKLLKEAADEAAQRHANAYEMAFSKQNELLALIAARLVGMEKGWQQAMTKLGQLAAEGNSGGEGDPMQALLAAAMPQLLAGAGMQPPQRPPTPPTQTNGKKG